jgi:tetratricopeptide (TPR) repeat protein
MKFRIFSFIQPLAFTVLCMVLATGCSDSPEVRKQKFLARGNANMREGNEDQALYYFDQALAMDSCFASALNNIGTLHFNKQRFQEALTYYNRAVDCNPSFLDARFNRANTLISTRQNQAALLDIDFLIRSKPDSAISHFIRGLALSRTRRYGEAIDAFSRSSELDSTMSFDSQANIAAVMILMRRYDAAEKELRRLALLRPNEPNIDNSLSLVKVEKGEYDSALFFSNRALDRSPKEPYFLNNRGFVYLKMEEFEKAEADINESLTIDPYNGWAYRNKAVLHQLDTRKKDMARSEELLLRAQKLDPFVVGLHQYLAVAYYNQGKLPEACREFDLSFQIGETVVPKEQIKGCKDIK